MPLAPRHAVAFVVLAVALVHPPTARGAAEPAPSCFTVRGRWPGEPVLRYRIEPRGGPLAPAVFGAALRQAMDEWQATGCVRFEPAAAEPDLVLAWGAGEHGPCLPFGVDPGVAHAGPVGPGTFVHFDAERAWERDALRRAALHELGHVLGLGHSPDEGAVMHAQPGAERAHLGTSDRAALHSLYGGGAPGPGDLEVGMSARLHGVAPPGSSAWTLHDTDGDGDAEVVLWRTDPAGHGLRLHFHFGPGPVLARTEGPLYGPFVAPAPVEHALGDLDGDGRPERVRQASVTRGAR
ncbi:MAG TPA: matrixin family metalloprotease [Planctomycetota bacterium]